MFRVGKRFKQLGVCLCNMTLANQIPAINVVQSLVGGSLVAEQVGMVSPPELIGDTSEQVCCKELGLGTGVVGRSSSCDEEGNGSVPSQPSQTASACLRTLQEGTKS